jgi:O-antigen ligase
MPAPSITLARPQWQYWLLAAFLLLVFLTGGASRIDVQSLLILRPASVMLCAIALITLRKEHLAGRRWLLWGLVAIMLAALMHLIPLPPAVWQALPGRQDLIDVEQLVGLSGIWRPLTITPINGWHALASLFTPLATLLLALQLNRDDLFRILTLVLVLGLLSALFGLLQVIGDPRGPLYLYRVTNNGAAVGLFANRNHAALLLACLFPILAAYATMPTGTNAQQQRRRLAAAIIVIMLVPLILVTGSRSGLIIAMFALVAAALLYRQSAAPVTDGKMSRVRNGVLAAIGVAAVVSLGFITYIFARAEAINRLLKGTGSEDNRADFWVISLDLFWKYFPAGSGSGSFVAAFEIAEPAAYLDSTYLNHAHNDWIEVAMTWGLPGVLFMAAAILMYGKRTLTIWRRKDGRYRPVVMARMASILLVIFAMGSFADYPLRTPAMMALFVIASIWLMEAGRGDHSSGTGRQEAG